MLVLPQVLDVSVNYQPIHNFLPEKFIKQKDGSRTLTPFILPHTNNRKLNDAQKWYINPIVPTEINDKKRQIPNIEEAQRLGIDKLAETLNVDPEEIGSPTQYFYQSEIT